MGDKEALSFRSRSEIDGFLQTPRFDAGASPFWYSGWRRINPHHRTERVCILLLFYFTFSYIIL